MRQVMTEPGIWDAVAALDLKLLESLLGYHLVEEEQDDLIDGWR